MHWSTVQWGSYSEKSIIKWDTWWALAWLWNRYLNQALAFIYLFFLTFLGVKQMGFLTWICTNVLSVCHCPSKNTFETNYKLRNLTRRWNLTRAGSRGVHGSGLTAASSTLRVTAHPPLAPLTTRRPACQRPRTSQCYWGKKYKPWITHKTD